MLRKSAAHQKKVDVDAAVRVLQTTTGVKVPGAMILAGKSAMPSGIYGRPKQESKGSCFCLCWRSFIAIRHDQNAVVGTVIAGIVIVSIAILRPNDDASTTKQWAPLSGHSYSATTYHTTINYHAMRQFCII
jgi:hypothetical protein